jgi:glycosyltransferase involved in cell wall biosynthesis
MQGNSNRILVFTTAFKPLVGGSEIALEEISRRIPDISFDIITPRYDSGHLIKEEIYPNVTVHRVGGGKYFFPWLGYVKAKNLNDGNRYKIIHSYQASFGGLAAALFKFVNPGIRFILTLQEGKDLDRQNPAIRWLRSVMIKKADHITAISSGLADYARRYNSRAGITIIPNGVDPDLFKKTQNSVRDKLGIGKDENVVITVSRLVPKNGVDILVGAISEISREMTKNIRLVIIGDGPDHNKIRKMAVGLDVYDKIIFTGTVPYQDLPGYLSAADMFVRPSRSEGLGSAFLEAMAVGLPVIATPVGGIQDFIVDKETGFFWKDSQGSLAEKIMEVFKNPALREKVASNARKLVIDKYGWDMIARSFKLIYSDE